MPRLATLFLVALVFCSPSQAADPGSVSERVRQHREAVKQRQEKIRREQAEFKRRMKSRQSRTAADRGRQSHVSGSHKRHRSSDAQVAARIAQSPSPEKCLNATIVGIRRADNMQQIVPLLASHLRENYQRRIAGYDHQEALSRRQRLMQEGRFSRDLITRMTSHPYEGELESFKRKAERFYGVESFTIHGNKARVYAYSHPEDFTLTNGKRPTAYFGMEFEDGYWRYSEYKYSLTVIR